MPYDKIVPLTGVPLVAVIENTRFEHDPIQTATLGRVSSAMIRQHNRSQRGQ